MPCDLESTHNYFKHIRVTPLHWRAQDARHYTDRDSPLCAPVLKCPLNELKVGEFHTKLANCDHKTAGNFRILLVKFFQIRVSAKCLPTQTRPRQKPRGNSIYACSVCKLRSWLPACYMLITLCYRDRGE